MLIFPDQKIKPMLFKKNEIAHMPGPFSSFKTNLTKMNPKLMQRNVAAKPKRLISVVVI